MPRKLEITLPTSRVQRFLERVQDEEGITTLSISGTPPLLPQGQTLVSLTGSNALAKHVHHILEGDEFDGVSISSSELRGVVTTGTSRHALDGESSELTWEELGFFLRKETNPTLNFFLLMGLCGAMAAIGLWQDMLHFVIGAMVLAPGFEPLLRIPFAFVAPRVHAARGAVATLGGYGTLVASAFLFTFLMAAIEPSDALLRDRAWVRFWSSTGPASVLMAIVGGLAGAATVSADRPVLTAGVMIALALVPSSAIVGMSLAAWDLELMGGAVVRWLTDAVLVATAGGLLFALKKRFGHRRETQT